MSVDPLNAFEERLQEIEAYLDLLDALERQLQTEPATIGGQRITAQQQRIMYSAVYLQLYNLVEATATWCIEAVSNAASGIWKVHDLTDKLRREWVRSIARTHVSLNEDNRLSTAVAFCELLLAAEPLMPWLVEKGRGGNWDDNEIEAITERLGCELQLPPAILTGAKRHVRDDKGPLALVKHLRNQLAHGSLSFTECGEGVTVTELRDIKERTERYLREVVRAYQDHINQFKFVRPERRPMAGTPS